VFSQLGVSAPVLQARNTDSRQQTADLTGRQRLHTTLQSVSLHSEFRSLTHQRRRRRLHQNCIALPTRLLEGYAPHALRTGICIVRCPMTDLLPPSTHQNPDLTQLHYTSLQSDASPNLHITSHQSNQIRSQPNAAQPSFNITSSIPSNAAPSHPLIITPLSYTYSTTPLAPPSDMGVMPQQQTKWR